MEANESKSGTKAQANTGILQGDTTNAVLAGREISDTVHIEDKQKEGDAEAE